MVSRLVRWCDNCKKEMINNAKFFKLQNIRVEIQDSKENSLALADGGPNDFCCIKCMREYLEKTLKCLWDKDPAEVPK